MAYKYRDPFVQRLTEDIADLIGGDDTKRPSIEQRLRELAFSNMVEIGEYWKRTRDSQGLPENAFRGNGLYFFPEESPALTFRTSGTSGEPRGVVHYSSRGVELMNMSILASARRYIVRELQRPIFVRLVPSAYE